MKNEKKVIPVRLDAELADGLNEMAKKDFRSLNGEIEYLIAKELIGRRGGMSEALLADCAAFVWNADEKRPLPVRFADGVRLSDLKLYSEEKREVVDNTVGFIAGLPAQNVLLYGDRGTGKSATVHAILNEFSNKGLRMIELKKSNISDFPRLLDIIADANGKYKFIVFIDDLSFADGQDNYAELKAVLEGSIAQIKNVLIYATSNRRHIIKENLRDRDGDVHLSDTLQEQISLSDRFGITVTFMKPDKDGFFVILRGILSGRGIEIEDGKLARLAETFCLDKGGRTPRGAKQLADILESKIKRGLDI